MHSEPTVAEREGQTDSAILGLLMLETSHRPWAIEEIAREMRRDVTDSLNRLYGAGLIHRLDGFVWATRAAVMADAIAA
ncbi:MAG TPA: hypothetical protein VH061_09310 [Solirubrobacteraceae bacterium]|jgi:hypothetical protein|nr:hypothetical protein [Solirubrobacteraceae bacterium]